MKLNDLGFLILALIFLAGVLVGEKSHACGDINEPEPIKIQVTEVL